jgi:hypothetical protein
MYFASWIRLQIDWSEVDMPRLAFLTGLLLFNSLNDIALGKDRNPWDVPSMLKGSWQVSLCVSDTHAWIRFRSVETGEVHTCGRYAKGFGGVIDGETGKELWPPAHAWGVLWDMDLAYESGLRSDMRVLRTILVRNPHIYRGALHGYGYLCVQLNCATYARNSWFFYSGEYYRLPLIATPWSLADRVTRRHYPSLLSSEH